MNFKSLNESFDRLYGTSNESNESLIYKLKEALNRLNEDTMSDEDKHDSEIIYGMIQKLQNRSNAAFTPEEKAIMQKYGITRHNSLKKLLVDDRELNPDIDTDSQRRYYSRSYSNGTPRMINYADRARKLPTRRKTQIAGDGSRWYYQNQTYNSHGHGGTSLIDKERAIQGDRMSEPVRDMRMALDSRRRAQSRIDNADAEREQRMQAAQAAFDREKERADRYYQYDTVDAAKSRDRAQDNIDRMLKKKPTEED